MFNSSRILNDKKITILGCDNDLKPTFYAGNCFLITENEKNYNLQMISDVNLSYKVFNKQKLNFFIVSIPANENYYKVMNDCIKLNSNYKLLATVELTVNTRLKTNIGKSEIADIEFNIVKKNYEVFISHPYFSIKKQKLKEII